MRTGDSRASETDLTVEDIMQAPYPSGLVAAPTGGAVAWVFNAKGVRDIWVADAASGAEARTLTAFDADDGFDLGELAWSADAQRLAFTRGGSLHDAAPVNITSSPDGPRPREVWSVSLAGAGARKVGIGHSASFSPDGRWLVFVDRDRILSTSQGAETPPETLIHDRGRIVGLTWSPGGDRLAFVSRRGAHVLVGVYDFAGRTIAWMAPSLDVDSSPVFSPDGRRIAFIRTAAQERPPFITRPSGEPWSIWVADPASGAGRRVWTADQGAGSVFAGTLSSQSLLWTAGDILVFPWEKTGWLHLYAMPAAGGAPLALTSGDFEVATLALAADRREVVFSSNQDDPDRLHVWTVRADGQGTARLSADPGIQTYPVIAGDGTICALQSDATRPLQPVRLSDGRWAPLAAEAVVADYPAARLVAPQSVTFAAADGRPTHGQLFLPRQAAQNPGPAVLFFHGGPQRQMLAGFHPMAAYNWMYAANQHLASQGYVVLSVNYRGGTGYGLGYREAEAFGPGGGSELNDLLGAVEYLKARAAVDSRRIGVWGGSYGGLMTALGLARASKDIAAGVDYSGVYNWETFLASIGAPVKGQAAAALAIASSPIASIDQWTSPVLIVQADDDRSVPSSQAGELIMALRARNIAHEALILPDEVHDLTRFASWTTLFRAMDAFFARHLATPPSRL